jgi:hypothetical protein
MEACKLQRRGQDQIDSARHQPMKKRGIGQNRAGDGPRRIESLVQRRQQDHPPIPLGKSREGRNDECREGKIKSVRTLSLRENPHLLRKEPTERIQSTRTRGREMAASSSRNLTIEERLKQLDETLEGLKQTLQYQLDFLENLDSEAGRRLEQLEQDISTVRIGFTEELGKLHQELKSPKDEFEERIGQLEGKMSKLNIQWGKDPKE